MTEYELSAYTSSIMGNFLTALAVYFSVITAYVVAAFSAGSRLSRTQLVLVNLCFAVAAGVTGFLAVVIFKRFWVFAQLVPNPDGAEPVDFSVPLAALIAGLFLASSVFMWDVRRSPPDA